LSIRGRKIKQSILLGKIFSFLYLSSRFLLPPTQKSVCQRRPAQENNQVEQQNVCVASIMAERYIPEHRRTQFKAKNTFKPEELRRRREEQQVEIRKAKREENLAKRRGIGTGDNRPGASLGAAPDSDDDTAPTESQVSLLCSCSFPPLPLLCLAFFSPFSRCFCRIVIPHHPPLFLPLL
jgi:hypothetical protein